MKGTLSPRRAHLIAHTSVRSLNSGHTMVSVYVTIFHSTNCVGSYVLTYDAKTDSVIFPDGVWGRLPAGTQGKIDGLVRNTAKAHLKDLSKRSTMLRKV